ncbi:MAG: hypothetical protein KBT00_02760 [Bacteroidales bacterium]|nr:hypothetical protein [Candidatus Cacconaster merdequi]
MTSFFNKYRNWLIGGTVGVAVLAGAFFIGRSSAKGDNAELMEELRSNESDAAVVKRVSQQMEAIAYQQKAISDRQRDRAEEQSQLALLMRDRAEQESRAAREAESKAVQWAQQAESSAREAQIQREMALAHQKEAEIQRDEATRAKSMTDTLSMRALGRTLGYSSSVQHQGNHTEVASMLAYAGWHFMKRYKGNTYQYDLFNALSTSSGAQRLTTMQQRGGVTALQTLDDDKYVAVSDYGEIELRDLQGRGDKVLLQNSAYNFRAVYADKESVYALSLHGPLCVVDYNRQTRLVELPEDSYRYVFNINGKVLLVLGEKSYCWYNLSMKTASEPSALPGKLSAAMRRPGYVQLFFEDGSYYELSNAGILSRKTPLVSKTVTAAYYDKEYDETFLGCADGSLVWLNAEGTEVLLSGHTSRIINLVTVGEVLISGSYDRSLSIWNLPAVKEYNLTEPASGRKTHSRLETELFEYLEPAEYYFETGWPLSTCRTGSSEILCGGSNGQILRMNVAVDDMAASIRSRATREFTQDEWANYIGSAIPYETLFKEAYD